MAKDYTRPRTTMSRDTSAPDPERREALVAAAERRTKRQAEAQERSQRVNPRAPKGASEDEQDIAGAAFETLVDVMISARKPSTKLRAAQLVRNEICGPIPSKVEIDGQLSLEGLVTAVLKELEADKETGKP